MENLEEVLQALDEFQKMRPSVIPQELEDYLCWVAKTGDPVYQWPLIKTLVREKLTRVMTDFYESCTTLEITPCPNVEHFNYDTMKSTLLERLESFVNAPFTVQRICELLTAPRKEYNRVDKFMRAIEKNILVVSTREPGPIIRRGEIGDGMVNGSVEEDAASVTQQQPPPSSPSQPISQQPPLPSQQPPPPLQQQQPPPLQPSLQSSQMSQPMQTTQPVQSITQDVEMEYWEKDCSSTVTISVHTIENESPLLHSSVIPAADSALAKNLFADETVRDKFEQAASRTDIATSNYITSDFSTMSNLNLQPHGSVSEAVATAVPVVQSLSAVETISDDSTVPGANIAVTIINEDMSSRSNLDMESEQVETTVTASTTTSTVTTAVTAATTIATSTTSTSAAAEATTTVTVVATVIPLTTNTTRKLQAAFQAKRFDSGDSKCTDKLDEKTVGSTEKEIEHSQVKNEEMTLTKSSPERTELNEMSHDENRLTENSLQTDIEIRSDALADNVESVIEERASSDKPEEERASIFEDMDKESLHSSTSGHDANVTAFVESQSMEKNSTVIVSSSEALYKTEKPEVHSKEASTTIFSTECLVHDQSMSQEVETMEPVDKVQEIILTVTSSNSNANRQTGQESEFNDDNLNIMEISNDKIAFVEPMTSEPINMEISKEAASVIEKIDPISSAIIETTEHSDNVSCPSPKDDKSTDVQDDNLVNSQGNKATACITIKGNQSSVIESITCRRKSMELMEVDDEDESLSTFQQDEPMEQETMELSKS